MIYLDRLLATCKKIQANQEQEIEMLRIENELLELGFSPTQDGIDEMIHWNNFHSSGF